MMRKFALLLAIWMLLAGLTGCGPQKDELAASAVQEPTITAPPATEPPTTAPEAPIAATEEPTESVTSTEPTAPKEVIIHENITDLETVEEALNSLVDISLYEKKPVGGLDSQKDYYVYQLRDNDYKPNISFDVTVEGSTNFTIPFMIPELQQQGWTLDAESEGKSVESMSIEICEMENEAGKTFTVHAYNLGEETKTPEELPCYKFATRLCIFDSGIGAVKELPGVSFTLCDSITEQSKMEEIIAKLGMPKSVHFWSVYSDETGEYEYSEITLVYVDGVEHYADWRW